MNATLISRAIYHASPTGYGRGIGAKVPKDYQFIPWDMLNVPWLHSLEQHMSEEQKEEHAGTHTKTNFDRMKVARENILCLVCIEKPYEFSVLVIVPPALRHEWVGEKFQIPIAQQHTVNGQTRWSWSRLCRESVNSKRPFLTLKSTPTQQHRVGCCG